MEALPIRRLGPGDEDVIARLAEDEPRSALLADPATIFLAAFDGDEPVGGRLSSALMFEWSRAG